MNCFGESDSVITLIPEPVLLEGIDQYVNFSTDIFYLEGSGYPYAEVFIDTHRFSCDRFKIAYVE